MPAHHTATVTAELELALVAPDGQGLPVAAVLRYEAVDPYAVRLGFHTGVDEIVEWTFARQLLTDGVTARVGEGDVQVWPSNGTATDVAEAAVCLSLCSPSGAALFEAALNAVVEFLSRTYCAVPVGSESDFIDVDAELALLLWTGATE
ncbi:MAG TPA: SsgA family sporulation/cell division regulator [Mycobacteriales bacterium]